MSNICKNLKRLIKLSKLQHDLLVSILEEEETPKNSSGIEPVWTNEENLVRLQSIMLGVHQAALEDGENALNAASVYAELVDAHQKLQMEVIDEKDGNG